MNNDHWAAMQAYTDAAWWCFSTSLKCFAASLFMVLVWTFVPWDAVWGLAALAWAVGIAWGVFCLCFCILYLMEDVCDK